MRKTLCNALRRAFGVTRWDWVAIGEIIAVVLIGCVMAYVLNGVDIHV